MGLFNNIGRYSDIHEYIKNFKEQTQSGLKLDVNNNYDIEGKRLANVGQAVDADDAVVKKQLAQVKADSLQVDGSSHMTGDLDLRGNKLILPGEINMNRKLITNLDVDENDDFSAVNMVTLKRHSAAVGDIDLQEKYNVLNSKQRTLSELKTHYDSLVSFEEVKENFLSRVETFAMGTQLDMNHHSITNLKDPRFGKEAATKDYADKKLALTGGRMAGVINMGTYEISNLAEPTGNSNAATKKYVDDVDTKVRNDMSKEVIQIQNLLGTKIGIGEIDLKGQKIVNLGEPTANSDAATKHFVEKSHVSQSGMQRNVFLYQMKDVLESSSQSNITVNGILKFANTPHTIFKNAYNFTIGKNNFNEYNARIGFNFYPVPTGAYTYVVEYFPPAMTNRSVDCLSTPLNVNKQIFKKFPTYVKNIVQIHKWQSPTPDYLMIDLKSVGDANSPAQGEGWMIVYGIEGTHNDVPSSVLDTPFLISRGSMLMQVPLNMSNQVIQNLPLPTAASQAASKDYVDTSGIYSILRHATATFIDGYIKQNAECLYSIERGTKEEVFFDPSTRAITTLADKTLSELNATQSTSALRPKLSTTKNAKRFFFTFDGTQRMLSNINLNPSSGGSVLVHVFILFRLATMTGSNHHFRNGLFGHDDGGWDKFVSFTPTGHLIISGTVGVKTTIGVNDWQTKANASELNKWCCMSIHWDALAGTVGSSCWVNGKKIKSFQARNSQGSNQMTFGDLDPNGIAGLNGDIQLFLLYKGWRMPELIIKAHHKMICERYGVDHDEISFP